MDSSDAKMFLGLAEVLEKLLPKNSKGDLTSTLTVKSETLGLTSTMSETEIWLTSGRSQ